MTDRRLDSAAVDKLRGDRAGEPQTREKTLAAASRSTQDKVQINVAVSQRVRIRLKVASDLTDESIRTLCEGFILDGLQNLENELAKRATLAKRGGE